MTDMNPLAENRLKLANVYLFWDNGKFALVPKTGIDRPTWAPVHEMFCDEYAFQDPGLWPQSRITSNLLKWVTLMMAWSDDNADHRAIEHELCRIDEYLEATGRTHLAETWTPTERLKLANVLFTWDGQKFSIIEKSNAVKNVLYENPSSWKEKDRAKKFLAILTTSLDCTGSAFDVHNDLLNIEEYRQIAYELPDLLTFRAKAA